MNKTLIIGLSVGAVVIIALGGVFLLNSKDVSQPTSDSTVETISDTTNQPKSLRELMSFANNQTCTFKDDEGNSGVVYVANNSMRGDFNSSTDDSDIKTHTIIKGNDMYLWFDDNKEGFQSSLDSVSSMQMDSKEDASKKTVDIDKQVDYDCESWTVDSKMFELPTTVTFTDYSKMMESAAGMMEENNSEEAMESGNSSQCQACNSLPSPAKAQCLQTLNCN